MMDLESQLTLSKVNTYYINYHLNLFTSCKDIIPYGYVDQMRKG